MRKVVHILVAAGVILSLAMLPLIGCAGKTPVTPVSPTTPTTQIKPIDLKFALFVAPTHHFVKNLAEPWVAAINQKSGGRIKATLYPGGSLGQATDQYDLLTKGTFEACCIVQSFTPHYFPLTGVVELPGCSTNSLVGAAILNGPIYSKYLAKEYEKVHLLSIAQTSPYHLFMSKKAVRAKEDLKGLKIRVTGASTIAIFQDGYGAVPVKLATPEQYEGLLRGTIDGTYFSYASAEAYKLWEVSDYCIELGFPGSATAWIMNKEFYEGLPQDLQWLVDSISADMTRITAQSYVDTDIIAKKRFIEGGTEVIIPSASEMKRFEEGASVTVNTWIAGINKQGLPGTEIVKFAKDELAKYRQ